MVAVPRRQRSIMLTDHSRRRVCAAASSLSRTARRGAACCAPTAAMQAHGRVGWPQASPYNVRIAPPGPGGACAAPANEGWVAAGPAAEAASRQCALKGFGSSAWLVSDVPSRLRRIAERRRLS